MTARAFREEELRAFGTAWTRKRPWFVGPVMASVVVLLHLGGLSAARVVAIASISLALFVVQIVWAVLSRKRAVDDRAVLVRQLATSVTIAVDVAITGGLASPLVPVLFAPTITIVATYGRSRESALSLGAVGLVAVLLAATDPLWAIPPLTRPFGAAITAVSILLAIVLTWRDVTGLADAYRRAGASLDRLREQVLDQAATRSSELESVGARVAHELKNPLAAIKGLTQLVARKASDDGARERLGVIEGEVERMEGILKDYLSFSRPLSVLDKKPIDVTRIAHDVLDVLEGRAKSADVRLAVRGGNAPIEGEGRRLKEALLNLVANAVEATPKGGTVTLETQALDTGVLVTVRDTGRGMSRETLDRVGTPYFTTRDAGTGLGVVLARGVLAQHGGTLAYDSEEGAGTTATIYLPRRGTADGDDPADR